MKAINLLSWTDGENGKWLEVFCGRIGVSLLRERFSAPLPAEHCRRIVDVAVQQRPSIATSVAVVLFRRWRLQIEVARYGRSGGYRTALADMGLGCDLD